ncbi:helix-turn-helix transcriptional regulator [Enterococcus sp. LJL98]
MENKSKNYRRFLNLTQLEMAGLMEMPLRTYQNKENGVTEFTNREMNQFKLIVQTEIESITLENIFSDV